MGLLVPAVLLGGCSPSTDGSDSAAARPNVILICMDTVRADRLGCYGYSNNATTPHLDELASQSTLFEDASATAGWTKPSVPSFLTGTYPAQHGVYEGNARGITGSFTHVLPDRALTLAEVFRQHGYRTGGIVHNDHLRKGNGFEQGFDHYDDQATDARDIRWRALDWLDEEKGAAPFFLYLHFLDAHYPYRVPDGYVKKFSDNADGALFRSPNWRKVRHAINHGKRVLTDSELDGLNALYDGAIRYIDDQLALLFQALDRRSSQDNTIICVLSDHGEEFLEHGRIGHGHGLYETLLRVPWILKIPGRDPARLSSPVSLVDVFPTLLAAAGIEHDSTTEGIDRLSEPELNRAIIAEHKDSNDYVQSYRLGSVKIIRRFVLSKAMGGNPHLADFLKLGSRWEVKLAESPGRTLRATKLKPKTEGDQSLTELKGVAQDVGASGLRLVGFQVRLLPTTEIYGEITGGEGSIDSLHEGMPIKAVGSFAGGSFVAQRIKVYHRNKRVKPLLRGRLAQVEGRADQGRLFLDGVWITVDRETDWDIPGFSVDEPRMSRDQIARALELGSEAASKAGFSIETEVFDLRSDPAEHHPLRSSAASLPLLAELDVWGMNALDLRTYVGTDKTPLSTEAIEKLRAIGYVD